MKKDVGFLHIGDIHFDSKYLGLSEEKRSVRRLETQMTLKRIISENDDAKIILFAGDIFDGELDNFTITFLCKLFEENADKHFFISCGNHDYLSSNCMKNLVLKSPQNLHIFGNTMSFYDLEEYGVRIYGCSFQNPHVETPLLENFVVDSEALVNIMLIHGEIDSSSRYNPIDITKVANSNIDYLALGHRHSFSGIKHAGKTKYVYPGIMEPRGFDECGKCGVVKGFITNGVVSVEFLPCSAREYEIIEVDITNLSSDIEIIEKINLQLNSKNLYRVLLTGCRNVTSTNLSLYEEMADAFYCEIEDKTIGSVSILDFLGENTLRGKSALVLDEYIRSGEYDEDLLKEVSATLTELLCTGGEE